MTCPLKSKVWPVKSPVATSKAARPREEISVPLSPCLTPVKLPPTYMVEPTWAKAWTWMLPSFTEPLRLPLTPHEVLAAYCETTPETVEAPRPSSGIRVKAAESEEMRGRT